MSTPHWLLLLGGFVFVLTILSIVCRVSDSERCWRMRDYAIETAKDGTTWRNLVLLGSAIGAKFSAGDELAVLGTGVMIAAAMGVFWPPRSK